MVGNVTVAGVSVDDVYPNGSFGIKIDFWTDDPSFFLPESPGSGEQVSAWLEQLYCIIWVIQKGEKLFD